MIDFASSLYLGFHHSSTTLPAWRSFTTGAPAAIVEPPGGERVARELAALIGATRGLLMPSTLHLFVDFFTIGVPRAMLFWDEALYPIAALAIELARARGVPSAPLPHLGAGVTEGWLRARLPRGHRPFVVSDGFCAGCGRHAPLALYADAVHRLRGLLVIDDTQALGLFGSDPTPDNPFGSGGGGSLRRQALEGAPLVVGASLAKSLGVPMACLAGPEDVVEPFIEASVMRVHASPPSSPQIWAASRALERAARSGPQLRRALAQHIDAFRQGLRELGLQARGGAFPVQSISARALGGEARALRLQSKLARSGVRTALCRPRCNGQCALTFVLRADHTTEQLERGLHALRAALADGNHVHSAHFEA